MVTAQETVSRGTENGVVDPQGGREGQTFEDVKTPLEMFRRLMKLAGDVTSGRVTPKVAEATAKTILVGLRFLELRHKMGNQNMFEE